MSQRDNFAGGFFLGALVGGIAGGVLGAVLASRQLGESPDQSLLPLDRQEVKPGKPKRRSLKLTNGQSIETARRSLEDKIAQLNDAIDDVRQQLGPVNGTHQESEPPVVRDP